MSGRAGFDVGTLVRACAAQDELVSLIELERWLGLRREVRLAVRGSEWAVARFWDGVREELPAGGLKLDDLAPWY